MKIDILKKVRVIRAMPKRCAWLILWLLHGAVLPGATENAIAADGVKPDLIYHNYCSVCHGDRGDGRSRASSSLVPPPRDFTTATNLTRELMIKTVSDGKPGTAMVGWKTQLSQNEIESVVDYIRDGFMQAAIDPHIARGRGIYLHSCANCHGESGKGPVVADPHGGLAAPDISSSQAKKIYTRERIMVAMRQDKHGPVTGAFSSRLPPQDIEAVADYVTKVIMVGTVESISGTHARGIQSKEAADAAPARSEKLKDNLGFPDGLVGNKRRGEKSFQKNCSACHGEKGDGQGPRAYFINPKPRNFTDASSAVFNRPMLFNAISMGKVGTVMPAWSTVLKDQEIADIAEFVYREFIQIAPAAAQNAK